MQHAMAYSVIMSPLGLPAPQICVDVESDSKLWTIEDVVHHVLLFPTWNPRYLQLLVASTTTRFDRVETPASLFPSYFSPVQLLRSCTSWHIRSRIAKHGPHIPPRASNIHNLRPDRLRLIFGKTADQPRIYEVQCCFDMLSDLMSRKFRTLRLP
jgi:hypothetical protein